MRAHNECFDLEPQHLSLDASFARTIGKPRVKGDKMITDVDWVGSLAKGSFLSGKALDSLKAVARERGAKRIWINTTQIVEKSGRLSHILHILQRRFGFRSMGGGRLFLEVDL